MIRQESAKRAFFLRCQIQFDNLLDPLAGDDGRHSDAQFVVPVLPVQDGRNGNDLVVVVQHGAGNVGERVADAKVRLSFAVKNFPARVLRLRRDIFQIDRCR